MKIVENQPERESCCDHSEGHWKLQKLDFSIVIGLVNKPPFQILTSKDAGATVGMTDVWSTADIMLKMRPPNYREDLGMDECTLQRKDKRSFVWSVLVRTRD